MGSEKLGLPKDDHRGKRKETGAMLGS